MQIGISLNSNLILLILDVTGKECPAYWCFKFQSDSINPNEDGWIALDDDFFKFQSDSINPLKMQAKKSLTKPL